MKNRSYLAINLAFIVFLAFFFGYSLIFSAHADNHPIPSFYTRVTGEETISTGLSRSFSDIIRGNFESANEYNIYGIRVFLFFFIQFFLRILFSFFYIYVVAARRYIVISDSIISIVLFITCFWPFIEWQASAICN
jgi:hypothetical protein